MKPGTAPASSRPSATMLISASSHQVNSVISKTIALCDSNLIRARPDNIDILRNDKRKNRKPCRKREGEQGPT
jgi:hypothetical protein